MAQHQEGTTPSANFIRQKTEDRKNLKEELGKLRRHMQKNGPPTTSFTTGAPLEADENSSTDASDRNIGDVELNELRNLIDKPLTKAQIEALKAGHTKPSNGLSEVENEHYSWLETRIPIVVKSLQAIQEEINSTNAKWQNLSDFDVDEEKLDELLIDDGKIAALGESIAELEEELTLFKRDHLKLADKIAKYKEGMELAEAKVKAQLKKEQDARDLAQRPTRNEVVMGQLNDIEREFDEEFANSDRITIAKPLSTEDAIIDAREKMNQARMRRGEEYDTTQFMERNSY